MIFLGLIMEFNFKDKKSAKLFISTNSNLIIEKEENDFFINSISKDEEIMVSSNPLEMDYLETLNKKSIKKDEPININSPIKTGRSKFINTTIKSY